VCTVTHIDRIQTQHIMKIQSILLVATAATSLLCADLRAAPPSKATTAESTKKTAAKSKQDTYPLYGKVVAITSRTLTVKRSDNPEAPEVKFGINSSTEYVNGESPATLEAVKVGSWVGGTVKKNSSDGNDVLLKVNVGVKQAAAKKAKKTATKKKSS